MEIVQSNDENGIKELETKANFCEETFIRRVSFEYSKKKFSSNSVDIKESGICAIRIASHFHKYKAGPQYSNCMYYHWMKPTPT